MGYAVGESAVIAQYEFRLIKIARLVNRRVVPAKPSPHAMQSTRVDINMTPGVLRGRCGNGDSTMV